MTRPSTWPALWSTSEDRALLAALTIGSARDAVAVLRGRSLASVYQRMRHLGVRKRPRWTRADDGKLRLLWGQSIRVIAKALHRTVLSVYWRAQKLGLGLGCPHGYEYLSAAAIRAGYAVRQLRQILHHSGVPIRKAMSRQGLRARIVEPDLVDRAVAKWMAIERTPHA